MKNKNIFYSKTFWVNVIALVAFIVQGFTGFVIDASVQASLLVVINLAMRMITGEPVEFGGISLYKPKQEEIK